jgi:hypothetical protein
MPEEPTQQPQAPAQGTPPPDPPAQGGGLSEAEIQQAIANSTDWIQKGQDQGGVERVSTAS